MPSTLGVLYEYSTGVFYGNLRHSNAQACELVGRFGDAERAPLMDVVLRRLLAGASVWGFLCAFVSACA